MFSAPLSLYGLLLAASAASTYAVPVSTALQTKLDEAHRGIYDYPTSFTQGIIPKGIHSHNDYWNALPFYTALSHGAVSVESDVWLVNGTLYVGHETAALTPNRTFASLYVDPILDVLERQNPASRFVTAGGGKNGVFDTASGQTLYLWVDLKTEGVSTWKAVVEALEPLRAKNYLAKVSNGTLTPGPVTVIGTGNTPLSLVAPIPERDYFWDAPLAALNTTAANITALVSPIASTAFSATIGPVLGTSLNGTQLALLRAQVKTASSRGIGTRYWDQPGWPVSTRDAVWRTLRSEGVTLINVDDLAAAAGETDLW